jgi:hypothetical protein
MLAETTENAKADAYEAARLAKIEKEKEDFVNLKNWQKERYNLSHDKVNKLKEELLKVSKEGKNSYRYEVEHFYRYDRYDDPVYNAVINFLKGNNIQFYEYSYAVHDLDYDMRQTDKVLYFQFYLDIKW